MPPCERPATKHPFSAAIARVVIERSKIAGGRTKGRAERSPIILIAQSRYLVAPPPLSARYDVYRRARSSFINLIACVTSLATSRPRRIPSPIRLDPRPSSSLSFSLSYLFGCSHDTKRDIIRAEFRRVRRALIYRQLTTIWPFDCPSKTGPAPGPILPPFKSVCRPATSTRNSFEINK